MNFHSGVADDDPEINIFIEDVQMASMLVESATSLYIESKLEQNVKPQLSVEQKYLEDLKTRQFGKY